MVIWDLEGKDDYGSVNFSYLRGAMGLFLVADGTRLETLETALSLWGSTTELIGNVPCTLLVNKSDLRDTWEVQEEHLAETRRRGIDVMLTSAKTGEGVDEAFLHLARLMV